jgi:hypothetical protein
VHLPPSALPVANPDGRAAALGEDIIPLKKSPGPQTLELDFRVSHEIRARRFRQTEVDRIPVFLRGKSHPQTDGIPAHRAFDRLNTLPHGFREALRAGPQNRGEAAFEGERLDDPALCDVAEKAKRTINARLAAAVGAGDDIQRIELEPSPEAIGIPICTTARS